MAQQQAELNRSFGTERTPVKRLPSCVKVASGNGVLAQRMSVEGYPLRIVYAFRAPRSNFALRRLWPMRSVRSARLWLRLAHISTRELNASQGVLAGSLAGRTVVSLMCVKRHEELVWWRPLKLGR